MMPRLHRSRKLLYSRIAHLTSPQAAYICISVLSDPWEKAILNK